MITIIRTITIIKRMIRIRMMISGISEMISFGRGVIPGGPRDSTHHLYLLFTHHLHHQHQNHHCLKVKILAGNFWWRKNIWANCLGKNGQILVNWKTQVQIFWATLGETLEEALFWQLQMLSWLSTPGFLTAPVFVELSILCLFSYASSSTLYPCERVSK